MVDRPGISGRTAEPYQTIPADQIRQIIEGGDAEKLVQIAQAFGTSAQQAGLTKSQIRTVFGTVRQIQSGWGRVEPAQSMRRVLLLKPRLAYQKARQSKVGPLADVLSSAIDVVAQARTPDEQHKRFGYFVDFFEAILAYHTAAGGK